MGFTVNCLSCGALGADPTPFEFRGRGLAFWCGAGCEASSHLCHRCGRPSAFKAGWPQHHEPRTPRRVGTQLADGFVCFCSEACRAKHMAEQAAHFDEPCGRCGKPEARFRTWSHSAGCMQYFCDSICLGALAAQAPAARALADRLGPWDYAIARPADPQPQSQRSAVPVRAAPMPQGWPFTDIPGSSPSPDTAAQIEQLASFLQQAWPHEIGKGGNEGAVDVAARLLAAAVDWKARAAREEEATKRANALADILSDTRRALDTKRMQRDAAEDRCGALQCELDQLKARR